MSAMMLKDISSKKSSVHRKSTRKPTLFVHAGTHKTGTSTIQMALGQSDAALRDIGYVYHLAKGNAEPNHNYLVGIGRSAHPLKISDDILSKIENIVCRIERVAKKTGIAIISSEEFSIDFSNPVRCKYWAHILQKYFDVRLVYYLRRPDQFHESMYAEIVKGWYCGDIEDAPVRYNYVERIKPAIENFGHEAIIVRPFNPVHWPNKCLVSDFLQTIGANVQIESPVVRNASFSRRKTLALSQISKKDLSSEQRRALKNAIEESSAPDDDKIKFFMSPAQRQQIYQTELEKLTPFLETFTQIDPGQFFSQDDKDENWFAPEPIRESEWRTLSSFMPDDLKPLIPSAPTG